MLRNRDEKSIFCYPSYFSDRRDPPLNVDADGVQNAEWICLFHADRMHSLPSN